MSWQFILALLAVALVVGVVAWRRFTTATRMPLPQPVPLPAVDHDPNDDEWIEAWFGRWQHYIYGDVTDPDVRAWMHLGEDGRWYVFWQNRTRSLGTAYVTDTATRDAANPMFIVWYFTGYLIPAAEKLCAITPDMFLDSPTPIPQSCRLPDSRPLIIRPSRP